MDCEKGLSRDVSQRECLNSLAPPHFSVIWLTNMVLSIQSSAANLNMECDKALGHSFPAPPGIVFPRSSELNKRTVYDFCKFADEALHDPSVLSVDQTKSSLENLKSANWAVLYLLILLGIGFILVHNLLILLGIGFIVIVIRRCATVRLAGASNDANQIG